MTIAVKEFRDRLRSGWIVTCALVWLGTIVLTSLFGLVQIGHIGVQGYERTTLSLLGVVQYLVPLLGLLVGHDLVVREREDRTLNLLVAAGISRTRIAFGKFLGGAATVAAPVVLGFALAGTMIGVAARDHAFTSFIKLAISGVLLGVVFCGIGLVVSTLCRSRVQALVFALLAWGVAVFAFDLAALGIIVSTRAVAASHEIEVVCDTTHVNAQADVHSAFEREESAKGTTGAGAQAARRASSFTWLWLNPVDVFRVLNLPSRMAVSLPVTGAVASGLVWALLSVSLAAWKLNRVDL